MKLAAANAIAIDERVAEAVARDVEEAAYATRVARRDRAAQEGM